MNCQEKAAAHWYLDLSCVCVPVCLPAVFVATAAPTSTPPTAPSPVAPTAPSPVAPAPVSDADTYLGCYEVVQYKTGEFAWDSVYSDMAMTPTVSNPCATFSRKQIKSRSVRREHPWLVGPSRTPN